MPSSDGEVLNLLAHVAEGALEPEQITLVAEALLRTARAREAEAWLRRALPDVERSGDWIARRRAVNLWGAALFELGELNSAELAFRRALELGEQEDDPLLVARAMNNLGQIANVRGRPADALVFYKLSVPAYQRLGHQRGLAETYHNMAISYRDLRELDRADECEQRAIEFARAAPVARLAALARIGRADLAFRRGDVALARIAALRGATECLGLGDPAGTADGLRIVGLACIASGEFADAASALERASGFAARGYIDEARRHARDALALFTKAGATTDHTALTEWYADLDGRADDAPSTPQGDLP